MTRQIILLVIGLLALGATLSIGLAERWEIWLVIWIPGLCVYLLLNPTSDLPPPTSDV